MWTYSCLFRILPSFCRRTTSWVLACLDRYACLISSAFETEDRGVAGRLGAAEEDTARRETTERRAARGRRMSGEGEGRGTGKEGGGKRRC